MSGGEIVPEHTRLHALVARFQDLLPAGYALGVAVPGDAAADAEIKSQWRERLGQYSARGSIGADDDLKAVPADAVDDTGRHVLVEVLHLETRTRCVQLVSLAQIRDATVTQRRQAVQRMLTTCETRVAAVQAQARG